MSKKIRDKGVAPTKQIKHQNITSIKSQWMVTQLCFLCRTFLLAFIIYDKTITLMNFMCFLLQK